jgi:hypothetical protein
VCLCLCFCRADCLNTEALLWLFVMEKYDSKDAEDEEIGRALGRSCY